MEKYFVQVNGNMWVKSSWSNVGSVMLTTKVEEVTELISDTEVNWLKTMFSDVKKYKSVMKEVIE